MARSVESAGDADKAIWWLQLGERRMYDIEQARVAFRQEVQRIRRTGRAGRIIQRVMNILARNTTIGTPEEVYL
jgi:hypothetical protein